MESHKKIFGFPPNVFFLSLVALFNDIGGETIKKTLPLYLSNVLGVPATIIGLIEGVANATPQFLQPVSGYISDRLRVKKPIVIMGEVMRAFMLLLIWAATWPAILFVRFLDRSGKGIMDAPRDALVAASAEKGKVGKAFGLTRMFDNGGAVIGLVLASIILLYSQHFALTHATFHSIVLLAVIPLVINIFIIAIFVKDIPHARVQTLPIRLGVSLGRKFYIFFGLSFLFTLGNSSDAFIVLKSQLVGMPVWQILLLLAGYSLVSSLSAVPLSSLSDRIGRKTLLITGWLLYGLMYILFASAKTPAFMIGVVLLYGLYYGFTEGSGRAYVSDIVPREKQGTAYGLYNFATGATLLLASLVAGYLWQTINPAAAFYFGSAMAGIAAVGLLLFL